MTWDMADYIFYFLWFTKISLDELLIKKNYFFKVKSNLENQILLQ